MAHQVTQDDIRGLAAAVARLAEAIAGDANRALGPDDWISTADLARRTGRHPETVRRWITDLELPAKRIEGGGWLIRYGDFLAWEGGADSIDHVAVIDDVLRRTG